MTDHGEVLRWSSNSEAEVELLEQNKESGLADKAVSEDETKFGVVWERFIIKETEGDAIDRISEVSETRTDWDELDANGARWTIEARVECAASLGGKDETISSKGNSPCLFEFEAFLGRAEATKGRQKTMNSDAYWVHVLETEKKRLEDDQMTRLVSVEDIVVGANSEDDELPIVATLSSKETNLSMLASVAELPVAAPKTRMKKITKSLWTYETVAEPTGAASKYWDASAPSERRTKRLAKEKLSALHEADDDGQGVFQITFV